MNATSAKTSSPSRFRVIPLVSAAICVAIAGLGFVNFFQGKLAQAATADQAAANRHLKLQDLPASLTGPWGQLVLEPVWIEAPEDPMKEEPNTVVITRWHFHGWNEGNLKKFLSALPVTNPQRQGLLDRTKWRIGSEGIVVTPESHVVLGISVEARQQLYDVLGQSPVHSSYTRPLVIRTEECAIWVQQGWISSSTFSRLKSLTYKRGSVSCLADVDLLLSTLNRYPGEQQVLSKLLHRTLAHEIRVTLPQETVDGAARYWTHAGGLSGIVSELKPGTTYHLQDLLPELGRLLLNTYPETWPAETPLPDNSGLTALKFFGAEYPRSFTEAEEAESLIREHFAKVEGLPAYGDVVAFLSPRGEPIHFAVYLAADLFYTKNDLLGGPWVINRGQDIMAGQPYFPNVRLAVYRPRNS